MTATRLKPTSSAMTPRGISLYSKSEQLCTRGSNWDWMVSMNKYWNTSCLFLEVSESLNIGQP